MDNLAIAFAEQSTLQSVRHIHITPAQTQVKDASSSFDTVECQRIQAIDTVCLDLAPHVYRNEDVGTHIVSVLLKQIKPHGFVFF